VRIRSVLAFGSGLALGASGLYLLDPEHGADRRRRAVRQARANAADEARRRASDARSLAVGVATGLRDGYASARTDA